MSLDTVFAAFADPPAEFGIMPFWFWNDDLNEHELRRQLRLFHGAGFGGVLPHARLGLSRRVGYLTPEFLRLVRCVAEEARELGLKVILYDEGSYPSGSAQGRVVAANPRHASHAIGLWSLEVEGPTQRYWRPNTGRALTDEHLCTVLGQLDGQGRIAADSLTLLPALPHDLFRLEVGPGRWRIMSVWCVLSGGRTRGVHAEEEDGSALAPAAADLLNPEAVASFVRFTHDAYAGALSGLLGDPVIAMFTDEPSVLGRGPQRPREPQAYTPGLVDWLQARWGEDPRPWLPALWVDYGPGTSAFRQRYAAAIHQRLDEVFYAAQARWCADHKMALTGHPSGSNEMTSLRHFQIPGQDMVWRYIEPGQPSGLEGPHSVAAKAATSGARLSGARRVLTEVGGAYGWRLTLDELKWLFDWHLVRGNNLISPHAVFYSLRGRRAWESEPDVGLHNAFWPYMATLANYVRRVCWALTDGEHVCQVAVLGDGHALPWQAARCLYQAQVDFLYLDDLAVSQATVAGGRLRVGAMRYSVVVVDGAPSLSPACCQRLDQFVAAGGWVLQTTAAASDVDPASATPPAATATAAKGAPPAPGVAVGPGFAWPLVPINSDWVPQVTARVGRDLALDPPHPDLRCLHYRKHECELYLLVNEGKAAITGQLTLAGHGAVEAWDPLRGARVTVSAVPPGSLVPDRERSAEAPAADRSCLDLCLERRHSLIVAIGPAAGVTDLAVAMARADRPGPSLAGSTPVAAPGVVGETTSGTLDVHGVVTQTPPLARTTAAAGPPPATGARWPLDLTWTVYDANGDVVPVPAPGDWAHAAGWELFTGTLVYRADWWVEVPSPRVLDLGQVGDIAEVWLDGLRLGACLWAPYRWALPQSLATGPHALEVRVTNSMANEYEGLQLPSGLIGPVCAWR
jgi:hypothetical protein